MISSKLKAPGDDGRFHSDSLFTPPLFSNSIENWLWIWIWIRCSRFLVLYWLLAHSTALRILLLLSAVVAAVSAAFVAYYSFICCDSCQFPTASIYIHNNTNCMNKCMYISLSLSLPLRLAAWVCIVYYTSIYSSLLITFDYCCPHILHSKSMILILLCLGRTTAECMYTCRVQPAPSLALSHSPFSGQRLQW